MDGAQQPTGQSRGPAGGGATHGPGPDPPLDTPDEPSASPAPSSNEQPSEEPKGRFSDRNLPIAIASGVLLAGLFVGSVLWHPLAFTVVVGILVVTGLGETAHALRDNGVFVVLPVIVIAAVAFLGGAYIAGPRGQAVGVTVLFLGALFWELADSRRDRTFSRVAHTLLLGLWVPFLGSYAVVLVARPDDGWIAILATAGAAIVADVGAYAVGTAFGRHKLAPTVSPGKTWEGVGGGILVSAGVWAVILPQLGDLFTWWFALVFALVVGTAGVLGDLVESMLKRDLGVKDFGAIIPGHGGILDRVDGILLALPVGHYLLLVAGT